MPHVGAPSRAYVYYNDDDKSTAKGLKVHISPFEDIRLPSSPMVEKSIKGKRETRAVFGIDPSARLSSGNDESMSDSIDDGTDNELTNIGNLEDALDASSSPSSYDYGLDSFSSDD